MKKITVKVPATSANLGPGYDCLGIALSLHSEFEFEESETLVIEGCPEAFQNENNLVYRAFCRVYEKAGRISPKVKLRIHADVPVARGLGSSSTCIAAGVLAADAFLREEGGADGFFAKQTLFEIATELEGHPDNAAPCLFGGLTASFMEAGAPHTVPFVCDPDWIFVTVIPDYEVKTEEARKVVKKEIGITDSVYSTSHAIAMVRALETGDERLLSLAGRDVLHEPYRKGLIRDYDAVREAALSKGAAAFLISGSGSTMIALTRCQETAEAIQKEIKKMYPQFEVLLLKAEQEGASAKAFL
ncbi:MAG: homoserine kinase [Eubacteriales bacterium]|nr:homoserine kinase [Eubacteriales bacterium]